MGLDKAQKGWLNRAMMKFIRMFIDLFPRFRKQPMRKSPLALERERLINEMKGQFLELKEKGLGIAIFTL